MNELCNRLLAGWLDLPEDQQRTLAWVAVALQRIADPKTPKDERCALRAKLERAFHEGR